MSQTDQIDLALLHRNTGGDRDLAEEILGMFRHQIETWSKLLDPNAPQSQWADAVHTLKGAALGVGAVPLSEVCALAEARGRSEETVSVAEASLLLSDVREAIGQALEASARVAHSLSLSSEFRAS